MRRIRAMKPSQETIDVVCLEAVTGGHHGTGAAKPKQREQRPIEIAPKPVCVPGQFYDAGHPCWPGCDDA